MLFNYKALESSGKKAEGAIEAVSLDVAIGSLQKRGLIIANIEPAEKDTWYARISFVNRISNKDVVILSRQMAVLFEAQVSALKIFTLLSAETENPSLRKSLDITVFVAVMVLMFTFIIPKISAIIVDSGQEVPIYTKIVFGLSNFFIDYGLFLLAALVALGFFVVRYVRTHEGSVALARFKLDVPIIGNLYRKLYLSVIADTMSTMISS